LRLNGMSPDAADHPAFVEAWFKRATTDAGDLPAARLVELFDDAMGALWRRAIATLGEVTLAAIVDRVLYTASETYPEVSALGVSEAGVSFEALRREGAPLPDDLRRVICSVLTQFLTVIGNLTDEIMTPALHAELARVALEDSADEGGDEDAKGARS
jgi:hypothetical protein